MLITDGINNGHWSGIQNLANPELKQLAEDTFKYSIKAREPNTVIKYNNAYKRWKTWTNKFDEISHFPAEPLHVSLYLCSLMQCSNTSGTVESAFYSLKWAHKLAGVADPTSESLPKLMLEASKRILSRPKNRKTPITSDMLINLCRFYGEENASLPHLRFLVMCLLSYAGFLRFAELIELKRADLDIFDSHLVIRLSKSKVDVYRQGDEVVIAKGSTEACPLKYTKRYLSEVGELEDSQSNNYLIRRLVLSKKVYVLSKINKPITYSRARELLICHLEEAGYDPKQYGLHSFRSGGATTAANNGIPDRLLKKHGRWRSEGAKDSYILDNFQNRLAVSLKNGL